MKSIEYCRRSIARGVAAGMIICAPVAIAADVTLSGTVTDRMSGEPVPGLEIGFTRVSGVGSGGANTPIHVGATLNTNASGEYSLTVSDTLPDLDRILVYTRSPFYYNKLYANGPMAGITPTLGEAASPAVTFVDLRSSVPGLDFQLDPRGAAFAVEMGNGVLLATDVYFPAGNGPWPVVLYRTPYDRRQDMEEAWPVWAAAGYAVVTQDLRGTGDSQDIFRGFHDDGFGENRDGYDTVEWILEQSWSNGRIGTIGVSARGITQNLLSAALPPGLQAQHITVAASNIFSQAMFQGGAYRLELMDGFMHAIGPAAENYLESEMKTRPLYDPVYWGATNLEEHYAQVNWPIVHRGGWYDIFLQGTINNFMGIQHNGQSGADGKQKLIIDPYGHWDGVGDFEWPDDSRTPPGSCDDEHAWLDHWLKDVPNGVMDEPAVRYYVLGPVDQPGGPGNVWRSADDWPVPATEVNYYLRDGGLLSTDPPEPGESNQS